MRVDNDSLLSSFWRSKKNSNSTQFIELYFGVLEQRKPQQPIGQAAEFKFESNQCRSSSNHSRRPFKKTIEGFDCKINGQALGAALRHSLGGSDGRARTQPGRVFPTPKFRVGGSCCWPRPARLRKMCYHSCDTDSV